MKPTYAILLSCWTTAAWSQEGPPAESEPASSVDQGVEIPSMAGVDETEGVSGPDIRTSITVEQRGRGPKRKLRYRVEPQLSPWEGRLTVGVDVERQEGDGGREWFFAPGSEWTFSLTQPEDGAVLMTPSSVVPLVAGGDNVGLLMQAYQGLYDLRISAQYTPTNGVSLTFDDLPDGTPQLPSEAWSAAKDGLLLGAVPWPVKPVGVGAVWTVEHVYRWPAATITQTLEVTLIERDARNVVLDVAVTSSSEEENVGELQGEGHVRLWFDLTRPLPMAMEGLLRWEGSTVFRSPEGEETELNAWMNQEVRWVTRKAP